jgi:hypothetical protein
VFLVVGNIVDHVLDGVLNEFDGAVAFPVATKPVLALSKWFR